MPLTPEGDWLIFCKDKDKFQAYFCLTTGTGNENSTIAPITFDFGADIQDIKICSAELKNKDENLNIYISCKEKAKGDDSYYYLLKKEMIIPQGQQEVSINTPSEKEDNYQVVYKKVHNEIIVFCREGKNNTFQTGQKLKLTIIRHQEEQEDEKKQEAQLAQFYKILTAKGHKNKGPVIAGYIGKGLNNDPIQYYILSKTPTYKEAYEWSYCNMLDYKSLEAYFNSRDNFHYFITKDSKNTLKFDQNNVFKKKITGPENEELFWLIKYNGELIYLCNGTIKTYVLDQNDEIIPNKKDIRFYGNFLYYLLIDVEDKSFLKDSRLDSNKKKGGKIITSDEGTLNLDAGFAVVPNGVYLLNNEKATFQLWNLIQNGSYLLSRNTNGPKEGKIRSYQYSKEDINQIRVTTTINETFSFNINASSGKRFFTKVKQTISQDDEKHEQKKRSAHCCLTFVQNR